MWTFSPLVRQLPSNKSDLVNPLKSYQGKVGRGHVIKLMAGENQQNTYLGGIHMCMGGVQRQKKKKKHEF